MSGATVAPSLVPGFTLFPPKNPSLGQENHREGGPYTQVPTPAFRPQTLWPEVRVSTTEPPPLVPEGPGQQKKGSVVAKS